ncbi:hypothetical protein SDRG_06970 [Saprolegnia diclina VS20]|uniref:Uncharacterized protein n=1 Tax=Saprolegnia diclina (strain VS20) TaxID=1156394 RepID=T0QCQ9_SAPDV|nr:hypothetical protein SDRG_06970 [Saprolegnia diclina VS20]EQC35689.1 hypothetical protein SDRG_06970 [Saprolegnia diclina VS20]|eukprot:XP_008611006.1 hypothetical protein SDRG_06970 [Saprolegnia diclina VS20]
MTTKQAAINDLYRLIPAANGNVGPVLLRYKQLLGEALVPFTNRTKLVAAISLGCSFGAVYQAPSTKPVTWIKALFRQRRVPSCSAWQDGLRAADMLSVVKKCDNSRVGRCVYQ